MAKKATQEQKTEVAKFDVSSLDYKKKLNIEEFEESQKALLKSCPFVKIINNKTYVTAKQHRTLLKTGRTTIQKQDRLIATVIREYRQFIKEQGGMLIGITKQAEEKQQSEINRWEELKKKEKEERERKERERIKKHNDAIANFKKEWEDSIDSISAVSLVDYESEKYTWDEFLENMTPGLIRKETGEYEEFQQKFELIKEYLIETYIPKRIEEIKIEIKQRELKTKEEELNVKEEELKAKEVPSTPKKEPSISTTDTTLVVDFGSEVDKSIKSIQEIKAISNTFIEQLHTENIVSTIKEFNTRLVNLQNQYIGKLEKL